MSCTLEPMIYSCHTGQQIAFFDSCQLTIIWIPLQSFVFKKHIVFVLDTYNIVASDAQSLQENNYCLLSSQSEHVYYCSHIINKLSSQRNAGKLQRSLQNKMKY